VAAREHVRERRSGQGPEVEQSLQLDVDQVGGPELAAAFAPHFTAHLADDELHHTPWRAEQHFTWLVLQRVP
jgi:hypothetical protein